MFFSSLRTKFALTYIAVVAIVLILINTYFLTASRDMIFSSKKSFVESQVTLIVTHLEESFSSLSIEDGERVAAIVSQLEITGGTHIIITNDKGDVIYDPTERSEMENFPKHYITAALEKNNVFFSEFIGGTFSSSAFSPIFSYGTLIGAVCFIEDETDQGTLMLDMQGTILNISIIIALLSIVIVTFLILSVGHRLNRIFHAVKSVREGEYNYTIEMKGRDEFALLSDEFNSLTGKLRETEEVRRRFVADASHELKTPLATIRLLTDSILQNPNIKADTVLEFISDINSEAERLSHTTNKLMTLTRFDSQISDELTRVNMKDAVKETVRMLETLAENRNVSIKTQFSDECYINGTEDSVHHIIFNLIENAIKYNHRGGSVVVSLELIDEKVVLAVKDRGIGVPDKDLPHIFDRFYRVDKSRSSGSSATGNGLGLAIVSDAVRELGGSVTAKKRQNGGMAFIVEFAYASFDNNG